MARTRSPCAAVGGRRLVGNGTGPYRLIGRHTPDLRRACSFFHPPRHTRASSPVNRCPSMWAWTPTPRGVRYVPMAGSAKGGSASEVELIAEHAVGRDLYRELASNLELVVCQRERVGAGRQRDAERRLSARDSVDLHGTPRARGDGERARAGRLSGRRRRRRGCWLCRLPAPHWAV